MEKAGLNLCEADLTMDSHKMGRRSLCSPLTPVVTLPFPLLWQQQWCCPSWVGMLVDLAEK